MTGKRRYPTRAMTDADIRRIEAARLRVHAAFDAALVGCQAHMGCADWINGPDARPALVAAYRDAREGLRAAEDAAIARGTHYRTPSGRVYPVYWSK